MASKKQRQDAIKKRDKRSKMALIACGVLFLGVAVYEVPSIMAMMNKKPPPGTTYDPGPSSTVGGAPTAATGLPDVAGGTASAASSGDLVDTDVPPASVAGQLVTFEVFQTKNPFTPQVTSTTPTDSSGGTSAGRPGADVPTTTTPTTTTPTTLPGFPTLPGSGVVPSTTVPTTTTPSTTTTTAAPAPTVSIAVNEVVSKVAVNGAFPSGTPVFRLVSYTHGTAQIGIVGGSYQQGGQTLTLKQGVPVTLQNTTDGKQYKLELLSTP
jgi:hypothetical protein